jgi:hypothetical protein
LFQQNLKGMKIFVVFVIMIFSFSVTQAQQSKKKTKSEIKAWKIQRIREIIDSQNFVFKAKNVNPANSTTKTLTSYFAIEVRNDTVFSYMPYYGKTYVRDYGTTNDSPMGFIQPILKYNRERSKKGYTVIVKVTNKHENIEIKFHILKTGSASVTASFINRQSISYNGEILIPFEKEEVETKQ